MHGHRLAAPRTASMVNSKLAIAFPIALPFLCYLWGFVVTFFCLSLEGNASRKRGKKGCTSLLFSRGLSRTRRLFIRASVSVRLPFIRPNNMLMCRFNAFLGGDFGPRRARLRISLDALGDPAAGTLRRGRRRRLGCQSEMIPAFRPRCTASANN